MAGSPGWSRHKLVIEFERAGGGRDHETDDSFHVWVDGVQQGYYKRPSQCEDIVADAVKNKLWFIRNTDY